MKGNENIFFRFLFCFYGVWVVIVMKNERPFRNFLCKLTQTAFAVWAFLLVFYFEYREGLLRWEWLREPTVGGFFRDRGLPDPRFEPAPSADMEESPYFIILKSLFNRWNIHWDNAPWAEMGVALLMIAALTGLGYLYVRWADLAFSRMQELCVSFAVGCGIIGIAGELLGMAHGLNRWGVLGAWVVLAAIGANLNRRKDWARTAYYVEPAETDRETPGVRAMMVFQGIVFGIISVSVFLHAVGEPIVYWDSLILYAGYARDMFLQQGFPLKTVGQVGIGLGANYPHLFPVLSAQTAALAGYWHDMFAQMIPPVASLGAMLMVYAVVKEMSRSRAIGLSAALLVRAIPYGIAYGQYASDYAVAIFFTSVFLFLGWRTIRDGKAGYRNLMLFMAAAACHINYLMLALWGVAAWFILLAYCRYREESVVALPNFDEERPAVFSGDLRETLGDLLRSPKFWLSTMGIFLLATPWYIRNVYYTGNPVYAFYYNLFPSINVNPDVMKSAEVEWLLNGDGLGRVGRTLGEKLRGSWEYFVTGGQHWKLAPVFIGFVLPGVASWILLRGRVPGRERDVSSPEGRFTFAITTLFLLLWYYAYAVADFYLYQIIIVLPLFGAYIAWLFMLCRHRLARGVLYGLTLFVGIFPGVVMGLMGFKLKNTGVYQGMPAPQFNLTALRQLFMDKNVYYRMEFGGDMEMIGRINGLPSGTKVLSHENRHLLLNPKVAIAHLDDWEMQQAYGKPLAERVGILDAEEVEYYLYMTNEDKHIANSWLGMEEIIREGYFEEVYRTPSSGSSLEDYPHEVIPKNHNVLYKRTGKK